MMLIENRTLADGSTMQIPHEIKPHKAKLIKQLPGTKKGYRAKNAAGGIKCSFTQAKEYKRKPDMWRSDKLASGIVRLATAWHGFNKLQEALKLRAELIAKLEARG